jgi:hypothetical protein
MVYTNGLSKYSVNDQVPGEYLLFVSNATYDDAGTYCCTDDFGTDGESKAKAELTVLKGDPALVVNSTNSTEGSKQITATFEYHGTAILAGKWIVTYWDGTKRNITPSNDEVTASGFGKKVVSRFVVLSEHKLVQFQIIGVDGSLTLERLYQAYVADADATTLSNFVSDGVSLQRTDSDVTDEVAANHLVVVVPTVVVGVVVFLVVVAFVAILLRRKLSKKRGSNVACKQEVACKQDGKKTHPSSNSSSSAKSDTSADSMETTNSGKSTSPLLPV